MNKETDRINLILSNKLYNKYLYKNSECEENREFCRHDLDHFLAVARIAYIINLEKGLNLGKDIIYAAAMLHDIGRWKQYEAGIPHDAASAELSLEILKQSGFEQDEINYIIDAIKAHRELGKKENKLAQIINYSDKKSRNCFFCSAAINCNWPDEKKNHDIEL